VKEPTREPLSLVHDFAALQHANVFTRAFCFDAPHLPVSGESHGELADRVMLMDGIGFIFQLCEREPKVTSRAGDLEKWVANQVARKGSKQIQNTREVLSGYMGLSMVNHFGHRVTVTPHDPETFVGLVIYRVPPKSRAFRAPRFKRSRSGGFVHILRDAEYFEICDHFATPAELVDYFEFRRDLLLDWDSASAAVSEAALIGQFLMEDYSSAPDPRFERATRSHGGAVACEFSFLLETLAERIASQDSEYADTDCYEILHELGWLSRYDLRALKHQLRYALDAVHSNRFELPYRIASTRTGCGIIIVPVTREFQERSHDALLSLTIASKHELDLERQVGIGMWQDTEIVDVEWTFLEGDNEPDPELDERLARSYPFRGSSEQRLPPVFT
jgi:hypothetical protein